MKERYLINEFENAAIRIDENGEAFVKFKGEKEFKAKKGSSIVTDAKIDTGNEITKEEYDNY